MSSHLSAAHTVRLLIKVRARRFLNRVGAVGRKRKKDAQPGRTATPGKSRGAVLGVVFGLYFVAMAYAMVGQGLTELVRAEGGRAAVRAHEFNQIVVQAVGLESLLLFVAALLVTVAAGELAKPEWDFEWLSTLPASVSRLLVARTLERAVVNPLALLLFGPFFVQVGLFAGLGAGAVFWALAVTLLLSVLVAAIFTNAEVALRRRWQPGRLRNLQAVTSLVGTLAMLAALMPMRPGQGAQILISWARQTPHVILLPPTLAVRAMTAPHLGARLQALGLLTIEVVVVAVAALWLATRALRGGLVAGGERESGRKAQRPKGQRSTWGGPLLRRELSLLARDRAYLSQTIIMPLVIVGMQFAIGGLSAMFFKTWAPLATFGFALGVHALMSSALQTLNTERQALWILFTLPGGLESAVRRKVALWATVGLVYVAAIVGYGLWKFGPTVGGFVLSVVAFCGVAIFAVIGGALGVFATDPLAVETQARMRVSFVYLYMGLAAIYGGAMNLGRLSQRAFAFVLLALIAVAFWQKARARLPYLLDPTAAPPARVSVVDGLLAALLFFVLQLLLGLLLGEKGGRQITPAVLLAAFTGAGAATFAVFRLHLWRTRAALVPTFLSVPRHPLRGGGAVALGAGLSALAAVIYLRVLLHHKDGWASPFLNELMGGHQYPLTVMVLLAVVAAPLFEEFIFRGLLFTGLKEIFPPWVAGLASAALFALVHPPVSVLPVFGLGVAAAFAYQRAGALWAPILVHAIYNAVAIAHSVLLQRGL